MTNIDFPSARMTMIESQIRPSGVRDVRVLKAFATVPREIFLPGGDKSLAYMDDPVEVLPRNGEKPARYLLQPVVLARMLEYAAVRPHDKVLDIACATGYSVAIFAQLARQIVAVEEAEALREMAMKCLRGLNIFNAAIIAGAHAEGVPDEQPFDVILINGAISVTPEALLYQLSEGGRLVAVSGAGLNGNAVIFRKTKGSVSRLTLFDAGAPAVPGFEAEPEFVF